MRFFQATAFLLIFILCLAQDSPAVEAFGSEYLGGEAIHRISLTSPLGAAGFRFAFDAQFQKLEVDTSAFDLHLSLAYGVLPGLDFAFYIPYLRMTQGEYYKAGPGDASVSLKFLHGISTLQPYSWGFQLYFLPPTGYQKEFYGFPQFSRNENGYGGRFIFQLETRTIDLAGNLGLTFTSKGNGNQLFFGGGARVNLLGKFLRAAGEFTTMIPQNGDDPQSFVFSGAEMTLPYIGIGLKLGAEYELGQDQPLKLVLGTSFARRKTIPGVSRGILETKPYYKNIMVFQFLDEEESFLGDDVNQKFTRNLASLEDVKIVEPDFRVDPDEAVKNRDTALEETKDSAADLLVFGRYCDFGFRRSQGFSLPYLLAFPRTSAFVTAEIWVIDTKSQKQIFSERITGKASASRGIAFFEPPGDSKNSYLDTGRMEKLRKEAIDDFVQNLSARFSYQLNR